jgi:hypothetical protein
MHKGYTNEIHQLKLRLHNSKRNTPTRFKIEFSQFTRDTPTRFIMRNWAQTICKRYTPTRFISQNWDCTKHKEYTHQIHQSKLRLHKSQVTRPRDSSVEIETSQIARDTPPRFISWNCDYIVCKGHAHDIHLRIWGNTIRKGYTQEIYHAKLRLHIHRGNTHAIHLASALTTRKTWSFFSLCCSTIYLQIFENTKHHLKI